MLHRLYQSHDYLGQETKYFCVYPGRCGFCQERCLESQAERWQADLGGGVGSDIQDDFCGNEARGLVSMRNDELDSPDKSPII